MQSDLDKKHIEWINKADEDELSAGVIIKEGGAPSTACFLSQQMTEKYLKGLLVSYNKEFQKVHDLLQLETLILEIIPEIQTLHKELELLNRYYIETRYPGDYSQFSLDECRKAYTAAKKVKAFVLNNLKNKYVSNYSNNR